MGEYVPGSNRSIDAWLENIKQNNGQPVGFVNPYTPAYEQSNGVFLDPSSNSVQASQALPAAYQDIANVPVNYNPPQSTTQQRLGQINQGLPNDTNYGKYNALAHDMSHGSEGINNFDDQGRFSYSFASNDRGSALQHGRPVPNLPQSRNPRLLEPGRLGFNIGGNPYAAGI